MGGFDVAGWCLLLLFVSVLITGEPPSILPLSCTKTPTHTPLWTIKLFKVVVWHFSLLPVVSSIKNRLLFFFFFCSFSLSFFSPSSSSSLLSTARLSLIRMMDGAELWLQPSPAASWELRDTEGEGGEVCVAEGAEELYWWRGLITYPVLHTGLPNKIILYRLSPSTCFRSLL